MLPIAPFKYGPWPSSGHIVFAESRGNENLECKFSDPAPLARSITMPGVGRTAGIELWEGRGPPGEGVGSYFVPPLGRQEANQGLIFGPSEIINTQYYWPRYKKLLRFKNKSKNLYFLFTKKRVNQSSDYASDFHLYRIEWLRDRFEFYIDDQLNREIIPPKSGFWELGKFKNKSTNPWTSGTRMAPFDAPVYSIIATFFI